MPKYRAILDPSCPMSWNRRDSANGILGEFKDLAGQETLFVCDDRSVAEMQIKARYYDHPNQLIYLCDDEGLVYGIFLHGGLAASEDKLSEGRWSFGCAGVLLGLATICSVMLAGPSIALLAPFAVFILYFAFLKLGILNSIESAAIFALLTILFYLLLPVIVGS